MTTAAINPATRTAVSALLTVFPQHVWDHIYEYDPTHRQIYNPVIKQVRWAHLIRMTANTLSAYGRVANFPGGRLFAYQTAMYYLPKFAVRLEEVGISPEDLVGFYDDDYPKGELFFNRNMDVIELSWNIRQISPKLDEWATADTKRQLAEMERDQDDQTDFDDDSIRRVYDTTYKYLATTILRDGPVTILTCTNMRRILVSINLQHT